MTDAEGETKVSSPGTEGTTQRLTLYHLNNSRSQSILWLLEELGIDYDIVKFQRTSEGTAPEEGKKIHPLGVFPILKDGPITLSESGAIIEYLIATYGGDKFSTSRDGWLDNLFYSHYPEGTLMPILVNKVVFTLVPKRSPWFLRPLMGFVFGKLSNAFVEPRLKLHRTFIESHLEKSTTSWFAAQDHPTSADFQMMFPMEFLAAGSGGLGPASQSFCTKVHDRPAYQRALTKGGEFKLERF